MPLRTAPHARCLPVMPDKARRLERLALALLWVVPVMWAVNYVLARLAPGVVGPYVLATGRWLLVALFLLPLSGNELWQARHALAKVWWQYLVLGVLGMLICGAWVYQGARSTQATNIALIYAASPVLIGLGAAMWLGEKLRLRQAAGVVLALLGVVHVVVKGRWNLLSDVQFVPGDLWIVAATVSWAAYAMLQKAWPSSLSSTARLAAICVAGVVVLLPFAAWELASEDLTQWSPRAFGLIAVAALVPGLGAYWIYAWAQKVLGASRVAVTLYLSPLYGGIAAWLVLGEAPGWHHVIGAGLILPGIFLVTARPAAQTPLPTGRSRPA